MSQPTPEPDLHTYIVVLSRASRIGAATVKICYRATDEEAKDAARRVLRMHRNTGRWAGPLYDRWAVGEPDAHKGIRMVGAGGLDD